MAAILYSLVPGPYHDVTVMTTEPILLFLCLCCLVVILANTPMESNGQGWVRMLFSHACLGLSVSFVTRHGGGTHHRNCTTYAIHARIGLGPGNSFAGFRNYCQSFNNHYVYVQPFMAWKKL